MRRKRDHNEGRIFLDDNERNELKSMIDDVKACIMKIREVINDDIVPKDFTPTVATMSTKKLQNKYHIQKTKFDRKKMKLKVDGAELERNIIQFYKDAVDASKDFYTRVAMKKKPGSTRKNVSKTPGRPGCFVSKSC